MGKLMTDDPARVAAIYLKRALDKGNTDDLKEVVTGWSHTDSTKAAEWVAKHVDEPEMQSALLTELELSAARTNPESHADGLVARSDSPQNRQLAGLAASRWADKAPDKAAEWAAKIEDPELFKVAVMAISEMWLKQNSIEASKWIGGLPAGDARDQAVRKLIESIKATDPAAADEWRKTLANP